jgi:hypothetical protein
MIAVLSSRVRVAAALFVALVTRCVSGEPLAAGTPSSAAAAETLLLPGVANALGTHAARWRSDLSVKNPGTDPIEVRVFFLKAGQPNDLASAPHKDYFLIADEVKELRNILGTELGVSGSGALVVSASRAIFPNNPAGASVAALMRTATPLLLAPGDVGSGIAPAEPTAASRQVVSTVRHDGTGEKGVRGAIGLVNLSRRDGLKVRIDYVDDAGELLATRDIHVPPLSTAQQVVPVRLSGGTARMTRVEGPGPFIGYATGVDNASGEATFTYAEPEPGEPTGVRPLTFGALAD